MAMRDPKFDPENQQYAVISINQEHSPATYSGKLTDLWRGSMVDDGVAIQGNSLVGELVFRISSKMLTAKRKSI